MQARGHDRPIQPGQPHAGLRVWYASFLVGIASLLWFPLTFILLLPQYQPVEQNPDRPI